MNVDEYLRHIGCEGLKEVSLENLARLQHSNVNRIPFEILDMHSSHKHIDMSLADAYKRIVHESRGGWCFQLNPLFCWLLTELRYKSHLVQVHGYNPLTGTHFSRPLHIGIVVTLNDKPYWVDVCSAAFVSEPLEITTDRDQTTRSGTYRFDLDAEQRFCLRSFRNAKWTSVYDFHLTPMVLEDFADAIEFAQSSAHPYLYKRSIVSTYTPNGYMRIVGCLFSEFKIEGEVHVRTDTQLTPEQVKQVIHDKFHLTFDDSFQPIDEFTNSTSS